MQDFQQHTGLIVSIANRYKRPGIDVQDLIQEGFLGMYEASKRYVNTKNTKFSTYATFWIKKFILKYIDKEIKGGIKYPELVPVVERDIDITPFLLELSVEDLKLVVLRYGFGNTKSLSYSELGSHYNRSREWARKKIKLLVKKLYKLIKEE